MSLADLRARVERAYANDRAEVRSGRDVSKWLAAVSYGECVALFEALAAAEAERDALRAAILADSHHGGEPERCGCGLCAVLAAPVPPAPDERET